MEKHVNEPLFRMLMEKITVYVNRLTVKFKSGLEIDVRGKTRERLNALQFQWIARFFVVRQSMV